MRERLDNVQLDDDDDDRTVLTSSTVSRQASVSSTLAAARFIRPRSTLSSSVSYQNMYGRRTTYEQTDTTLVNHGLWAHSLRIYLVHRNEIQDTTEIKLK